MTFYKPLNLSYTDMCIWIDNNMYKEDCDDSKLYEYLYHIVNMFARKGSYFRNEGYYDDFALSSASKLFMRIQDTRLTKIKSILNYIKTIIYPYKVDFEKTTYIQDTDDISVFYGDMYALSDTLLETTDIFDRIEFNYSLDTLSHIIKQYLKKIPYKRNSAEWFNIYISCILTLLESVTISDTTKLSKESITDKELKNYYLQSEKVEPVLYHLDKKFSSYIKVLVNEIKCLLARQLSVEDHTIISTESAIKSVILSTLELED